MSTPVETFDDDSEGDDEDGDDDGEANTQPVPLCVGCLPAFLRQHPLPLRPRLYLVHYDQDRG